MQITKAHPNRRNIAFAVIGVLLLMVIGASFTACANKEPTNKVTKDDFITSAALEKAIEIDNLSTAEFIYNGIAEHNRDESDYPADWAFWENRDPIDYRVSYKATVKAQIEFSAVKFEIDNETKTVTAILPEITLSSTVSPDGMKFIPEGADANMQEVFELCEADVETEALERGEIFETAEENLKATVEALTLPILSAKGYTLEWGEGE